MEIRQIKEFLTIDGAYVAPSSSEDGKTLVWNNSTGVFDYATNAVTTGSNTGDVTLNASATTGGMSIIGQDISNRAATNALTGYATPAHITAIEANTAKVSNVSTTLSTGTVTSTTYGITSDGGVDDLVLVEATTAFAGLLGAIKWDEIVSNTALAHTHVNKAVLDLVTDEGSGLITTDAERALWNSYVAVNEETIRDTVADFIQDNTGITWVHDDPGDTLTPTIDLGAFDTDDLPEGSANLYYTDQRARTSLSAVDNGGLGSFTYNNVSGVSTYTGVSTQEVRDQISSPTGYPIGYDSLTGFLSWTAGDPTLIPDSLVNAGLTGEGWVLPLVGTEWRLRNADVGSSKVTVTENVGNLTLEIDIVPGNILTSELNNDALFTTQDYVDNLVDGVKRKQPADVATTENITLLGEQTIDGILTSTSRVLVKDQTDGTKNGIYTSGAGVWTRTDDADTGDELVAATLAILTGTLNENKEYNNINSAITLGVTSITFVRKASTIDHNSTSNKDGGLAIDEYYHLKLDHYNAVINATTPTAGNPFATITDLTTGYVPYTGANNNVELSTYTLSGGLGTFSGFGTASKTALKAINSNGGITRFGFESTTISTIGYEATMSIGKLTSDDGALAITDMTFDGLGNVVVDGKLTAESVRPTNLATNAVPRIDATAGFINGGISDNGSLVSITTALTVTGDITTTTGDYYLDSTLLRLTPLKSGLIGVSNTFFMGAGVTSDPIWQASSAINLDIFYSGAELINKVPKANGSGAITWGYVEAGEVPIAVIGTPTYDNVQDFINTEGSAGQTMGGAITDAGSQTYNVAAGTGYIRTTDSHVGDIESFDWVASNGIAISDATIAYVFIDYNAGSPQVTIKGAFTSNTHTEFFLGTVVREGTTLHVEDNPDQVANYSAHNSERLRHFGFVRVEGLILGETGTRNITVTAGEGYKKNNEYDIAMFDSSAAGTFDTYIGMVQQASAQTQWDNANYNNAGSLTALSNNRYGVLWVYEETDGGITYIYGTSNTVSLAGAQAEGTPSVVPLRTTAHGFIIGRIIFQEGAATAAVIETVFENTFSSTTPSDHNNLSGINGLSPFNHLGNTELSNVQKLGTGLTTQMIVGDGGTSYDWTLKSAINVGDFNDDGTYVIPSELHAPVTVSGAYDYITLVGQDLVRGQVDYTTDISNIPSVANYVSNAGSSTDNAIAKFDLATGKIIQNSGVLIDDSNNVTGVVALTATGALTAATVDATNLTLGYIPYDNGTSLVDSPFKIVSGKVGLNEASPEVFSITNNTVGDQSLRINHALSTGSGIVLFNNSSNTSTDTGGLIRIHQTSTGATQPAAVVRQDGTGDILQLFDNTGLVFSVADGGITTITSLQINDANTTITEDGSSNMVFTDAVTGSKTLAELVGGGGYTDPLTTRGDVLYRNPANATARLPIGTVGRVLESDGTDVSWGTVKAEEAGDLTQAFSVASLAIDSASGWTIDTSGTSLVFKYNGAVQWTLTSTGTVTATDFIAV